MLWKVTALIEPSSPLTVFLAADSFLDSSTWNVVRNVGLFLGLVFWASTVYWVYKDARRRIEDPWLIAMATLLGAIPPFLGPLIYMLFRPPEYLEDVRERELEIAAIEEQLADRDLRCPVCRGAVDASFLVCPVCTTRLKQACEECGSPLEPIWQVCPYCATPVPPGDRHRRGRPAAPAPAPVGPGRQVAALRVSLAVGPGQRDRRPRARPIVLLRERCCGSRGRRCPRRTGA